MTVAELREAIDRLPDDMEVLVRIENGMMRDLAASSAMVDRNNVNTTVLLLVTEDADDENAKWLNERSER